MRHPGTTGFALIATLLSFASLPSTAAQAQRIPQTLPSVSLEPASPAASTATRIPAFRPYSGFGASATPAFIQTSLTSPRLSGSGIQLQFGRPPVPLRAVVGTSKTSVGVLGISGRTYGVEGKTSGIIGSGTGTAAGVYGNSSSNAPGVLGKSTTGDGGDFVGCGGAGVSASGKTVGGSFSGDSSTSGSVAGGLGLDAIGGDDQSPFGFAAGIGIKGTGGYSELGSAGDGGDFYGGTTHYGFGGAGIYASGGYNADDSRVPAGIFDGDITLSGTVISSLKQFRIDHPLDPANKYLAHASVESSEMVDLYSGNVVTDAQGSATVRLPDWFESLNGDLRYQLTTIGKKAQVWISEEIKDGSFKIASDPPDVKVSWQITGVRQDPYAKAHPLVVQQDKNARERGLYQNPELYGQPREKQTEWKRHTPATRPHPDAAKAELAPAK